MHDSGQEIFMRLVPALKEAVNAWAGALSVLEQEQVNSWIEDHPDIVKRITQMIWDMEN